MKYIYAKNERKSDSKESFTLSSSSTTHGNVTKRLLVLFLLAVSMVFAGAQTTQSLQKSGCEFVCGDPFIDPNTGQCVQECCPADEKCMQRCELIPCKQ
jgi:hypothetical protein